MCITLEKAHLAFGDKVLVDNLSLSIKANTLTVILGKNGTGKSSLLKLLSGDISTQAKIAFYGKAKSLWHLEELASSVGFLPQHSELTFAFTVREVVELGGIRLKRKRAELHKIVDNMMALTEVSHLANRRYPSLSGGEKQRVHLARVLTQIYDAPREKIIMLDEPTSALDIRHQHKTLALAKQLSQEGAAVIAVLHDLNLAAKYGDRLLMLNQGKLVADGAPQTVLTPELIQRVYDWPTQVIPHPLHGYPVVIN
jgi:iron complex transport system ATP-binding protein